LINDTTDGGSNDDFAKSVYDGVCGGERKAALALTVLAIVAGAISILTVSETYFIIHVFKQHSNAFLNSLTLSYCNFTMIVF
jgi:hypothetical protein